MLIQFNYKNFKSFKNETSFDMMAASLKEHSYNLIDIGTGDKYLSNSCTVSSSIPADASLFISFHARYRAVGV